MWKLKISEGNDPWLVSLNDHVGRQHWEFDPEAGTPEERAEVEKVREEFKRNRFKNRQSADILMRMQLIKEKPSMEMIQGVKLKEREVIGEEAVTTTLKKAINFFTSIQAHDGHWPADNAGPLFLIPPLVMTLHVIGDLNKILSPEHQKEIKRYIYNHQNEDGGGGFHTHGHSTMLGSAINYIALRLMGEGPDDGVDNAVARGRQWILDHGGATSIPSWGKFWLAVSGVYEWDGCNPMSPELWLLPDFLPMHPGSYTTLCIHTYCRLVYMPVSYLYGRRFVGPITQLIQSLRTEIYPQPYHEINWNKARNSCAKEDLYTPHHVLQDMIWGLLHHISEPILNRWPFSKLRAKALKTAIQNVHYENDNSRYCSTGCIEKVLCLMACWVEDPNSTAYKKHLARLPDYLWVSEDGMKLTAVGSQTWDATFAFQAIYASGLTDEYATPLRKAHGFLKASQVKENPSGNFKEMYRHICKGAWTFSTLDHGWQVSDCTAALLFAKMFPELEEEKVEAQHLYDAVNVLLSLQSENGGLPAWEAQRTYSWIEKFNPTELFGSALIEREHVECTSSVIQALTLFKEHYPDHRTEQIKDSISRGIQYIESTQNPDGSWYGFWGICFTYATWFAVEALLTSDKNYHNSQAVQRGCEFLLSKQLPDGGWGESYLSSSKEVYTNLKGNRSNVVQTSWALLTLIRAGQWDVDPYPVDRGMRLVINSQLENGDFPPQESTGIFMKNCTVEFSSYRCIFPIWVLSEYRRVQAQRLAIL